MSHRRTSTEDQTDSTASTARPRLQFALDQLHEDCLRYNEAVGSYNTHLDNHRERRDLHDLPFREPISAHTAFERVMNGDPDAIEDLLTHLIDQIHLDSQLRRHPRTFPIHEEAVEQLQIGRDRVITTLEEAYLQLQESDE